MTSANCLIRPAIVIRNVMLMTSYLPLLPTSNVFTKHQKHCKAENENIFRIGGSYSTINCPIPIKNSLSAGGGGGNPNDRLDRDMTRLAPVLGFAGEYYRAVHNVAR